ncbi:hypothetical protein BpHYR1_049520 [Brachionus plicatilis]|uniref:Uncharacterized protein n=1 Tax=Brachionus plicatilis TaxID=10195 RepID=A0A3M7REG6_BRAPC|nr:hypothetical protein BpHYR1_049520 [Brachionus plicatilis]
MKSFTRSSVYQGYKTVEGQLVSGDAFPSKALQLNIISQKLELDKLKKFKGRILQFTIIIK